MAGKPNAQSAIEYGKIKLFSSSESVADLMSHLKVILDKYNYPEMDKMPSEDEIEESQDDDDIQDDVDAALDAQEDALKEESVASAPVPVSTKEETTKDDPWVKIMKQRQNG